MDEPTARRRRHARGDNTVSVADLLAKSTPEEPASRPTAEATQARPGQDPAGWPGPPTSTTNWRAPARPTSQATPVHPDYPGQPGYPDHPELDEQDDDEPPMTEHSDEGNPPDEDGEEPRSSSRLAKTIIGTLVAMAAIGVVTTVAAVAGEPPRRLVPSVPVVQPVAMTGPNVLRLSVVINSLSLGSPEARSLDPATSAPATADPLGATDTPPSQTTTSRPTATQRGPAESIVVEFYEALHRDRPHAYSLLSPAMQGDGQESFEASWARAHNVNVRIIPTTDEVTSSIQASVTVSRSNDPEVTRLILRLEIGPVLVDGTPQLRIVGAQLLSAHRS